MSKAKSKSAPKKADPLASALALEKKTLETYKKMEADATKKDNRILMKVYGNIRKDAEKHIRDINNASLNLKKEEEKRKERERKEKERMKTLKAAKK